MNVFSRKTPAPKPRDFPDGSFYDARRTAPRPAERRRGVKIGPVFFYMKQGWYWTVLFTAVMALPGLAKTAAEAALHKPPPGQSDTCPRPGLNTLPDHRTVLCVPPVDRPLSQ